MRHPIASKTNRTSETDDTQFGNHRQTKLRIADNMVMMMMVMMVMVMMVLVFGGSLAII